MREFSVTEWLEVWSGLLFETLRVAGRRRGRSSVPSVRPACAWRGDLPSRGGSGPASRWTASCSTSCMRRSSEFRTPRRRRCRPGPRVDPRSWLRGPRSCRGGACLRRPQPCPRHRPRWPRWPQGNGIGQQSRGQRATDPGVPSARLEPGRSGNWSLYVPACVANVVSRPRGWGRRCAGRSPRQPGVASRDRRQPRLTAPRPSKSVAWSPRSLPRDRPERVAGLLGRCPQRSREIVAWRERCGS